MFKLGLTAVLTAAVCFAIAAASGLGASSAKVITLKTGPDRHAQVRATSIARS